MKLPDELPENPYVAVAIRLSHFHIDEEEAETDEPGTLLLEIAGKLPGTDADVIVPFELTSSMALDLIEDLVSQYRCLVSGSPDDEDDFD